MKNVELEKDKENEKIEPKLTPKESIFLRCYLNGMSETDSYLHVEPNVTRPSAGVMGCKWLKRLKEKLNWGELMEVAGLGEVRLLKELRRHLEMKKVTFWQGEEIEGDYEDAPIQLRATEILVDLLGKRKFALELMGKDGQPIAIKYEAVTTDESEEEKVNGKKSS